VHEDLKSMLNAFAREEITWAELEGMTQAEAESIATMGCELAAAGRLDDAKVLFEGLVAGNPKDPGTRAALGTVYQKLGRADEALAEYDAAIRLDPLHPVALAHRGELRLMRGDEGGCEDLTRAVKTDPAGTTAAGQRAMALTKALTMRTAGRATPAP